MFRFFCYLKGRGTQVPVTDEEKDIASGKKPLSPEMAAHIAQELDVKSDNIKAAFVKQQELAAVTSNISMSLY